MDNLIQWDFLLEDDTFVIELIGLNHRTEMRLWAAIPFTAVDWASVEVAVGDTIRARATEIAKIISELERWHLFANPYARLKVVTDQLEARLIAAKAAVVVFPDLGDTQTNLNAASQLLSSAFKHAAELLTLATVLQSSAPVMAEAAVNLLLHVAARDELRNDERLMQDTLRRNIDVRVKRLSIDCRGFERPIDASHDIFKKFHSLMNRRNDSLHGNVNPKATLGDPIYFDQRTIPLSERHSSFGRQHHERIVAVASADAALADLKIVRDFIAFVIGHAKHGVQQELQMLLDEQFPGYCPKRDNFGVVLPRVFVDMIFRAGPDADVWSGDGI